MGTTQTVTGRGEDQYPHSWDVQEREWEDEGFSAGWAMQAKPKPEYYFDAHIHYDGPGAANLGELLKADKAEAEKLAVQRQLLIVGIQGKNHRGKPLDIPLFRHASLAEEELKGLDELRRQGYFLSGWLYHNSPDPAQVKRLANCGVCSLKLHNAPLIMGAEGPERWETTAWQEVFVAAKESRLPIVWHVTQRMSPSPYTGGGRNVYWEEGWAKGLKVGNEEYLQSFLRICRRNPEVNFIGAHQLYLGWERLGSLFDEYPNLYADTSIGCQLLLDDNFYPPDREYLREVFIRWADRILFGSDLVWTGAPTESGWEHVKRHTHFIKRLELPDEALQKICHLNAEKLLGIPALPV